MQSRNESETESRNNKQRKRESKSNKSKKRKKKREIVNQPKFKKSQEPPLAKMFRISSDVR